MGNFDFGIVTKKKQVYIGCLILAFIALILLLFDTSPLGSCKGDVWYKLIPLLLLSVYVFHCGRKVFKHWKD
jgi:hypothetical protein